MFEIVFQSNALDFRNNIAFWKVPRLRQFFPSGLEHCQNDIGSETNPTSCYFVLYKSHTVWPGIEPGHPW